MLKDIIGSTKKTGIQMKLEKGIVTIFTEVYYVYYEVYYYGCVREYFYSQEIHVEVSRGKGP